MRILYVVRLFSGLEGGLRERQWRPQGVPTIYKMIEELDRSNHDAKFIFTCKGVSTTWTSWRGETFHVAGLNAPVVVFPGAGQLPRWLGRVRGYLAELIQSVLIWRVYLRFKPDLIYFDRANIYHAALFSHLTRTAVVWRLMGVPPAMHDVLRTRNIVSWLTRVAYRAPFALVICSRDGSGGERWMEIALAPSTCRKMLINGADEYPEHELAPEHAEKLRTGATKVLFVARLVENKGCLPFVAGFLGALAAESTGLHAVVAGDGPLLQPMLDEVRARGATQHVTFLGQLPHNQIPGLHCACDIYVSLNPMGNLTNANLEALRFGACMIIPASQPHSGIDTDTDELIPSDVALRVSSSQDSLGLTNAILHLHCNPDERSARGARAKETASRIITSWDLRIREEIDLLESLPRVASARAQADGDDRERSRL